MKLELPGFRWAALPGRIRGMFNLNDPKWGRGDDKPAEAPKEGGGRPNGAAPDNQPQGEGNRGQKGPNQGPPDLDELWRDLNRKLGGLFGGAKAGNRGAGSGGGNGSGGAFSQT